MDSKISPGLKKYIVKQNYEKYTSEDQAIWRYIMKQIKNNLSLYGCKGSLSGMEKTGITFDRIPRIENIDAKLQKHGWRAVPVSGFIPPVAFMEFQWNQILPIASELRTLQHISYTPAPDIVHEAVGHIPFLVEPTFSQFLKEYAQTVKKAIFHKADLDQYEAIRKLSDTKENPLSTEKEIQEAENHLQQITRNKIHTSESSALSRFIWWTSEYGLMREGSEIKIFGAGLISSVEEARHSMSAKVEKIPLTKECLNYGYDITRFQPQLFVAESFPHLREVLKEISQTLAWKQGGWDGLQKALQSQVINTVELNSGLQISGVLESRLDYNKEIYFLKWKGPCQLSFRNTELPQQGREIHAQGYSTPLGLLKNTSKPLQDWTEGELERAGVKKGLKVHLTFASGVELKGDLLRIFRENGKLLILTFKDCWVQNKDQIYFKPEWGEFDLGVGQSVTSVFPGVADKQAYREEDDGFQPSRVAPRTYSPKQKDCFKIYQHIEDLNHLKDPSLKKKSLQNLLERIKNHPDSLWLASLELLEQSKNFPEMKNQIILHLENLKKKHSSLTSYLREGQPFYS